MTFEEAKEWKANFKEEIEPELKLYVVPLMNADYEIYLSEVMRIGGTRDSLAKEFSSNGEYTLAKIGEPMGLFCEEKLEPNGKV